MGIFQNGRNKKAKSFINKILLDKANLLIEEKSKIGMIGVKTKPQYTAFFQTIRKDI